MATFPTYFGHAFVVCHNCDNHLVDVPPKDSGYPPGRGASMKTCPKCGMSTWFDLHPKP